jgi:triosephosphate isomerase
MRKPLIVGNWKMWGSREKAKNLVAGIVAQDSDGMVDWGVCPPFPYLMQVLEQVGCDRVGAQTVSADTDVPHTGDVSAAMLADLGVRWAIVGHSERRAERGESDGIVSQQLRCAIEKGLTPILCVGETLEQREQGNEEWVVRSQLEVALAGADAHWPLVIAYEPVWAIGTGVVAEPHQVQAMHAMIRSVLSNLGISGDETPILYGGSVKPENANGLFALDDVDGALVGGASLDSEAFLAIIEAACSAQAA